MLSVSRAGADTLYRRGALAGAICLGVCGLAVFVPARLSASAPPKDLSSTTEMEGAVFVDEAVQARSTKRGGFAPYQAHRGTLAGEEFSHSLMTEVSSAKPSDALSVLTLKIDGRYERFRATVGRSDDEARTGPAYVYFEVWGDGTCFFRSTPIRSAATMVTVAPGAPTRKTPQAIDIIVRGTRTLQLVTRFATIEQQAPDITRARGCVWGDPRLLTASALAGPSVSPAAPLPPPAPEAAVPTSAKNRPETLDPRRESVRMAVLLLASGVGRAASPDANAAPSATLRYPLKIALLPLRPWERQRRRPANAGIQPADTAIQTLLESSLPTAKRGSAAVFTLLDRESTQEIARAVPPSFATSAELTSTDMASLTALWRGKAVDAVLFATLSPGSDTKGSRGTRLELRLFDAAGGSLISRSFQMLSLPSKN